jgi:endonuclease/exonuclease/phosphatase family metal-dependent hydrolase
MNYAYVGKISSANHKDKYKSILSRTPLTDTEEIPIKGRGWNPCSVVKGTTVIRGVKLNFYSLHVCQSNDKKGHGYFLASEILSKDKSKNIIVVGDFNNHLSDFPMVTLDKIGYRATWKDVKIDLTKKWTWNAFTPKGETGVIDHILYNTSSGAKARQAEIIEMKKHISDHKAVRAEIIFPKDK